MRRVFRSPVAVVAHRSPQLPPSTLRAAISTYAPPTQWSKRITLDNNLTTKNNQKGVKIGWKGPSIFFNFTQRKKHSVPQTRCNAQSSVGLGHTLNFVLLLDSVRVAGALGCVHNLVSQAFGDGLDVSEGSLASARGQQEQGVAHASHG